MHLQLDNFWKEKLNFNTNQAPHKRGKSGI